MIAFLILVSLACETPQAVVSEAPLVLPTEVVNTITIKVPSDCPHLIVDVMTTTHTNMTVACFSHETRTYFFHEEQPCCAHDEQPRETQLTLQYVDDPPRLSSVP